MLKRAHGGPTPEKAIAEEARDTFRGRFYCKVASNHTRKCRVKSKLICYWFMCIVLNDIIRLYILIDGQSPAEYTKLDSSHM